MNIPVYFYPFFAFALMIMLQGITKRNGRNARVNEQGFTILNMHEVFLAIGLVAMAAAIGYLMKIILIGPHEWAGYYVAGLLLVICGMMAVPSILLYRNHKVMFDDDNIEVKNMTGKSASVKWDDVADFRYDPLTGFVVITGRNGEKLKIYSSLNGIELFKEKMVEKGLGEKKMKLS